MSDVGSFLCSVSLLSVSFDSDAIPSGVDAGTDTVTGTGAGAGTGAGTGTGTGTGRRNNNEKLASEPQNGGATSNTHLRMLIWLQQLQQHSGGGHNATFA